MGNGRWLLVATVFSGVACHTFREPAPRDRPTLVVRDRAPLDVMPGDQFFTFVSAAEIFSGVVAPDTQRVDQRRRAGFKQSVLIPLTSMGWNESSAELATFRVALIEAERARIAWVPVGECMRRVSTTMLMRGFAIERVSDRAVFWRLYPGGQLEQDFIEKRASDDIANFVLGRVPASPMPEVVDPPPQHLRCSASVNPNWPNSTTTPRRPAADSTRPRPGDPPRTPATRPATTGKKPPVS